MKRFAILLSVAGLLTSLGIATTAATAAPPSPDNPAGHSSDVHGVVPAKNFAGHGGSAGANLSWHGGSVLRTNATYALYWNPSNAGSGFDGSYVSTINGFFSNVAGALSSKATSNVYWSDTQYYDGGGAITNASAFRGSFVDTAPIVNDCTDRYTAACVSDQQIQSEVQKVRRNLGWTATNAIVFVFTAKGIGSCYSSGSCAFSQYCAYHSNIGSSLYYANMPYAMTVPAACDSGQHPNNGDADATLNVTSHEHNEAITDPLGTAWYDNRGYENGDKCAWTFGSAIGGSSGAQYNQVIGTGHYYLQREWTNAHSSCVLTGL